MRQRQLGLMRESEELARGAKIFYREHPVEFIEHWVDTYDPRNASHDGRLVSMPFVLFPRQREFVEFLTACLSASADGLVEKCRDMGATWLCCAFSIWIWLFLPGASVGWGSRKEALVDKIGDPDSIFEKLRMIIRKLPDPLLPVAFDVGRHTAHMKIINPETGATITGEGGDNIGRGGRKLVYFKDESAHYEHPELIEAALTDNTRVQIDISSVHGLNTVFHRKREAGVDWEPGKPAIPGKTNVFVFDWRDHPEKTQAWYDQRRQKAESDGLLHKFAQEVERNYAASVSGVVIPAEWVVSAIDADQILGIRDDGGEVAGLDVADDQSGVIRDTNALARRRGVILRHLEEWGERDTGVTTRRALAACAGRGRMRLMYDCVGVGSGVKSEANRLKDDGKFPGSLELVPWSAGDGVLDPDRRVIPDDRNSPLNKDFYGNLKAQGWWQLRRRFELTHRAVRSRAKDAMELERSFTWNEEDLISLPSSLPLLRKLQKELSQATVTYNTKMKLIIDKTPDGAKSPNLADAVVMCYWPIVSKVLPPISDAVLAWASTK